MAGLRVLVVDDEKMIRWALGQMLTAAGYEVAEAGTADEGMKLFRELLPRVVFLDLCLPDGDGLKLLRQMKEESGPRSAVIVMTAHGETYSPSEAKKLGAFDFFRKPFDFDEIAATVAKASAAS